jgi:hypothetical protein
MAWPWLHQTKKSGPPHVLEEGRGDYGPQVSGSHTKSTSRDATIMNWLSDSSQLSTDTLPAIQPANVFAYYDGPLTFSMQVGMFWLLCHKIDEDDSTDLFLCVETKPETIKLMSEGCLSVRGALKDGRSFVARTDRSLQVIGLWHVDQSSIPEDLMPDAGVAISSIYAQAPDDVIQSQAFFSLHFDGSTLHSDRIMFSRMKAIIDGAYEFCRRRFLPMAISSKQALLQMPIYQPKLGSLILSLDKPLIDESAIKRRKDTKDLDVNSLNDTVEYNREELFSSSPELIELAKRGEISQSYISSHFTLISQLNEIVPSKENEIDIVHLTGNFGNIAKILTFEEKVGKRIKEAYKIAQRVPQNFIGRVCEFNGPSNTLIIETAGGRQITCSLTKLDFEELDRNNGLKRGARLSVTGNFAQRKRRDFLDVSIAPRVLS